MSKKLSALILAMLLVFAVFAGCAKDTGNGDDGAIKTLTLHDGDWLGTDLYRCANWTGLQDLISDSFFIQDPNDPSNILPNICEDMIVSDDGLTIKLVMPADIKFYDGTPVTPEDVIASIEYGQEYSDWGYGYSNIQSMEADGKDVVLHLSEYRSDLIYFLSHAFMGVLKADGIKNLSQEEMQWGAIPYGQFYVDEYVAGSHIVLKPNPHYKTNNPLVTNKGASNLEYITIKVADMETFALNTAIAEGDLDMLSGITMEQYAELKDTENVTILDVTFPNIEYFEFNQDSEHLSDIRVRKAIMKLLDRDSMEKMCNGAFKPEYSMITSNVQFYSDKAAQWFKENLANDVDGALKLLEEAGYEKGSDGFLYKDGSKLSFTFLTRSSGTSVTVAQDMAIQLKEYGIEMSMEAIDWNYIYERIENDDYDAGIETLGWGEPILVLNYCYYDGNSKSEAAFDAYYQLVEKCATTSDPAEVEELVYQIQMQIFEDAAMVPLYSDVEYCAYRTNIPGIVVTKTGGIYFNDVK